MMAGKEREKKARDWSGESLRRSDSEEEIAEKMDWGEDDERTDDARSRAWDWELMEYCRGIMGIFELGFQMIFRVSNDF